MSPLISLYSGISRDDMHAFSHTHLRRRSCVFVRSLRQIVVIVTVLSASCLCTVPSRSLPHLILPSRRHHGAESVRSLRKG